MGELSGRGKYPGGYVGGNMSTGNVRISPNCVLFGCIFVVLRTGNKQITMMMMMMMRHLQCMCLSCALCSGGVGRTGIFITLSIVLERMRFEGVVDMFQTVNMLRAQRPFMVQSEVFQSSAFYRYSRFHSHRYKRYAAKTTAVSAVV